MQVEPTLGPVVTERVVAIGAPGEGDTVDVWQYFAENINEFAVAKSLVDHFDAHPNDLSVPDVDAFGLYLRAKVTIKREQISYAQTQAAVTKAREQSRRMRGVVKSFLGFASAVRSAVASNPTPVAIAATLAALVWFR